MNYYQVSNNKFTCLVVTDNDGIITDAAPILHKFVGQHKDNLKKWMNKLGKWNVYTLNINKKENEHEPRSNEK